MSEKSHKISSLGDHPLLVISVAFATIVSCCLPTFIFVTGKQSLPELLRANHQLTPTIQGKTPSKEITPFQTGVVQSSNEPTQEFILQDTATPIKKMPTTTPHPTVQLSNKWIKTVGKLTLQIDRLEKGDGFFNVWMTVTNNTKDKLTLPLTKNFYAIDDLGNQYEADSFNSTFPTDIASGATVSGYAHMQGYINSNARAIKVTFSVVYGSGFDSLSIRSISVEGIPVP